MMQVYNSLKFPIIRIIAKVICVQRDLQVVRLQM